LDQSVVTVRLGWRQAAVERTLVIIKPDAVERDLVGKIMTRLETKGLHLVGVKMMKLTEDLLNEHYQHLSTMPFFPEIKQFMASTPVVVTCWEGTDCVATVRRLCGITKAREAEPGTIRGDWAMSVQANLVHASDTLENAESEIRRFFTSAELFDYEPVTLPFIYSSRERQ
jgi:nucleoside-diphosphate kinase